MDGNGSGRMEDAIMVTCVALRLDMLPVLWILFQNQTCISISCLDFTWPQTRSQVWHCFPLLTHNIAGPSAIQKATHGMSLYLSNNQSQRFGITTKVLDRRRRKLSALTHGVSILPYK
jgi:hypothetical protein